MKLLNDFIPGSGQIIYDPKRGEMRNNTRNWVVINVDREITRYYRWWIKRHFHLNLDLPSWDAHISVVRGEASASKSKLWKSRQKENAAFEYEHGAVFTSKDKDMPGHFFWIRVKCDMVDTIRTELGLEASWKYHHLTIGRTNYDMVLPKVFHG